MLLQISNQVSKDQTMLQDLVARTGGELLEKLVKTATEKWFPLKKFFLPPISIPSLRSKIAAPHI